MPCLLCILVFRLASKIQLHSQHPVLPQLCLCAEYVQEFQKCLDRTEPVPWSVVQQRIESELGRPLSSVFSYINPVPLASASVAQVHEAGAACFSLLIMHLRGK